jgi:hypothetical protein
LAKGSLPEANHRNPARDSIRSSSARNAASSSLSVADSLDDARQKFRASGQTDSDALFIIKTETEIYLA